MRVFGRQASDWVGHLERVLRAQEPDEVAAAAEDGQHQQVRDEPQPQQPAPRRPRLLHVVVTEARQVLLASTHTNHSACRVSVICSHIKRQ